MTNRPSLQSLKTAFSQHFNVSPTAKEVRRLLKADDINLGHLDLRTTNDWQKVCEVYGLTESPMTTSTITTESTVAPRQDNQWHMNEPIPPMFQRQHIVNRPEYHYQSSIWLELEGVDWDTNSPVPVAC